MVSILSRLSAILLLLSAGGLTAELPDGERCYLVGNSLTWDTVPARLAGDPKWHVDCGKSLPWMFLHPDKPCVKSSTLWPAALAESQYDVLVLQVHYGSTLAEDATAIGEFLKRQPKARVVIHTGWARSADRAQEWKGDEADESSPMKHNVAYFRELLAVVREAHPGRTIERTRAMDALAVIASDIAVDKAPVNAVAELYRDAIHMDVVTGRYLMHNCMRLALGQERSAAGFEKLEPAMKAYLDSVLDRVHGPQERPEP